MKTVTKEGMQSLAKEVMESAIKSGPLDVLTTIGFNAYDYGLGENKDKRIISQQFAVSVSVDLVQSVVAGLAAALLVAGVVALLPVLAPAIVVSAPIVLGITAGTAMLIDMT
ncbi:MAG: hypothetical protein IPJ47_15930 [Anaerolineales bacterium]|nr:hypothetical protein [Anaerolineales bacterium]